MVVYFGTKTIRTATQTSDLDASRHGELCQAVAETSRGTSNKDKHARGLLLWKIGLGCAA